jgi:peroxiredoxin (alkyl hydroperoxide reductase subunit C)
MMKKTILILIVLFSMTQVWSQDNGNTRIPVIGEKAPSFTATTTNGKINFPSDYGRSWKILLSHPQDFTPVCSSELLELAYLQDDFNKMNVKLLVVSTDNLKTHNDWVNALDELTYKGRGPVKINFPLAADDNYTISKEYGMIHKGSTSTKDVRAVFIIDPSNIIQAIIYYPMNVGRNMDEIKRTVLALQTSTADKVSTPANWQVGGDVLVPVPPSSGSGNSDALPAGYYKVAWFMLFKKANETSSLSN